MGFRVRESVAPTGCSVYILCTYMPQCTCACRHQPGPSSEDPIVEAYDRRGRRIVWGGFSALRSSPRKVNNTDESIHQLVSRGHQFSPTALKALTSPSTISSGR